MFFKYYCLSFLISKQRLVSFVLLDSLYTFVYIFSVNLVKGNGKKSQSYAFWLMLRCKCFGKVKRSV